MRHVLRALRARNLIALAVAIALVVSLAACTGGQQATDTGTQPKAETSEVILASTTSTQDSGLFDVLIPAFEKADPEYQIKVIAVGTGEALKLGESKDADVLLVHAKADEEKFVAAGNGTERKDVMYNDFLIVGPKSDPAGVNGSTDTTAAMKAIADAGKAGKATFVSRGDDSGTNKKELKLWTAAGVEPTTTVDKWYESTGQGMGETLKIASEKDGYTLVDRATYLSMQDTLDLGILLEKDKGLLNQYGVIVVTDAKNQPGGQAFADWIVSPEGQKVIGEFGVEEFKQQLFVPNANQ
ncbi:MAG: extracellular solute-binding protein [Coriobacteriales bacterium]|nr:extracellular solute-binding protein [Coriobacteriales bacterium]